MKNTTFYYSDYRKKHGVEGVIDWDYIKLDDVNGCISNVKINNDSSYFELDKLSFKEKSGFKVRKLFCHATIKDYIIELNNLELITPKSSIKNKIHFYYDQFSDFEDDFINKVKMDVNLAGSTLNLFDISFFAEEMKGIDKEIVFQSANAKGYVSDFTARELALSFGKKTHISGKLRMTGLPDINSTLIDFRIKELITDKKDIEGIPLPPFTNKEFIILPKEVERLGTIKYTGDYTGFYNDFVTYGKFYTAIGNAQTDMKINYNLNSFITSYNGSITTENFEIGKLLNFAENVGKISMTGKIKGSEFTVDKAKLELSGNISAVELNGYNYQNIIINGKLSKKVFNGHLEIDDENLAFVFDGDIDYNGKIPQSNFSAQVKKAHLTDLKIIKGNSFSSFSGDITLRMDGKNLNEANGNLVIDKTIVNVDKKAYQLGSIKLNKKYDQKSTDFININSKFLDANLEGEFNLIELTSSFKYLIHHYFQNVFYEKAITEFNSVENFSYSIKIKDSEYITNIFLPNLSLPKSANIEGNYDVLKHSFSMKSNFPNILFNGINLKNVSFEASAKNNEVNLITDCKKMNLTDSIFAENLHLKINGGDNSLNFLINWENNELFKNSGNIKGDVLFFSNNKAEIKIFPSTFTFHDSTWITSEIGRIKIDSTISINKLDFHSGNQKISMNGIISKDPNEVFYTEIRNFNLSNLNMLTKNDGVELAGIVNGKVNISNTYQSIILSSSLNFSDLKINNELIGTGDLISIYDAKNQFVNLNGNFIKNNFPTIAFNGNYYPYRKINNLDFNIKFDKTPLQIISIFTAGIISDVKGNLTGTLKLNGDLNKPIITGSLLAQKSGFKVDYLNTSYSFSSLVDFKQNSIELNNASIYDEFGNSGKTDFKLFHNSFRDFKFDIIVDANKLFCLNTNASMNDLFYGKAYASGLIKINGTTDNIIIGIAAKTEKGTKFFIPLSSPEEVNENNIVHFVNRNASKMVLQKNTNLSGIQMNFDLEITPDAETQIIFDQKVGDIIKGRGKGNIKMEINTLGQFNMFGDFSITDGDYLFTLKNVINKRFKIEPGGNIRWNGDPYEALVNINAIYSLKTSISPIIGDTSSTGKRSVPVDCKLKLTDRLFNPNVNFEINLTSTTIDQSKKDEFNSLLRPDNVQEINRQIFSLLVLGSFLPLQGQNSNATRLDVAGGAGANSMELLTNQLNNWLSGISKSFDLGVKYRPGSELTSRQMEMAVSTQLFNDKLSINGNFGVNNNQNLSSTSQATNIVGDVKVEYKLSDDGRLRLKAYNQTNDISQVINTAPYTQGLGIFYREEFNSFDELLKRYKKTLKKKDKQSNQ